MILDGKNALVAGVANKKSIAWGIAQALHAAGAEVGFTCLPSNEARLRRLTRAVDSACIVPCDVARDEDIARAAERVGETFDGRLDILIHAIAMADLEELGGEFIKTTREGFARALDISAYSLVALARAFRPLLAAAGGASVQALTFYGSSVVVPGYNIMGVAKAALEAGLRYLAYDLGPDGIRVNGISAGPIATISSLAIEDFDDGLRRVAAASPMQRNISLADLGAASVYLASDGASAVTGHLLHVDAGMHCLTPGAKPHRRSET